MLRAVPVGGEMHGASAGQPVHAASVQANPQKAFDERLGDAKVGGRLGGRPALHRQCACSAAWTRHFQKKQPG